MKKRTVPYISLFLTLSLLLCACNNKKEINIKPDTDNTQVFPSEETESESETEVETQSQTQQEETVGVYTRKYEFGPHGELINIYTKDGLREKLKASYQYGDGVSYKWTDGKYTLFTYWDDRGQLKFIDTIDYNGEYKLKYLYEKVTLINNADGYFFDLVGFECNGVKYDFVKDENGLIVGISDTQGNQIVKYEYLKYKKTSMRYWVPFVKSFDGEKWDVNNDPEFIGNINRVFGDTQYYDADVGLWISGDDFVNPVTQAYITGIKRDYKGRQEIIDFMYE